MAVPPEARAELATALFDYVSEIEGPAHITEPDQQDCCRRLADWLAREQRLARAWTPATAADMLWALMSFELLEALLVDRGWTPRDYGDHLTSLFRSTFVQHRPVAAGR